MSTLRWSILTRPIKLKFNSHLDVENNYISLQDVNKSTLKEGSHNTLGVGGVRDRKMKSRWCRKFKTIGLALILTFLGKKKRMGVNWALIWTRYYILSLANVEKQTWKERFSEKNETMRFLGSYWKKWAIFHGAKI